MTSVSSMMDSLRHDRGRRDYYTKQIDGKYQKLVEDLCKKVKELESENEDLRAQVMLMHCATY